MILRVLGSAAGGGVPQWNCACANCAAAREGRAPKRTQSSLALSADGEHWLLINCSPDVAQQIESYEPLQPKQLRDTPLESILLTDANVDHLGGLTVLRQAGSRGFSIHSSGLVRALALKQTAFARFGEAPHSWTGFAAGDRWISNGIAVRPFGVCGTTPGYDGRRRVEGAVTAYELRDVDDDRTVLVAPVFAAISRTLHDAISRASVAFLDGSFFSCDELRRGGLSHKLASDLGHLPMGDSGGTLDHLRKADSQRIIFTHINNSNPVLDPQSAAAVRVRSAGAEIAFDGLEVSL